MHGLLQVSHLKKTYVYIAIYTLTYLQERCSVHVQDILLEQLEEEEVTSECDW